MKKSILLFAACLSALTTFAQVENGDNRWTNIDWKEDSTEVVTIDDIIKEQQAVTSRNTREMHYADVWGRRSFFNIADNTPASLTPKTPLETGYAPLNQGRFLGANADWSVALQRGRNYCLHKKPIANTLQINIDYSGLDLSVSHFKGVGGYNSSAKHEEESDGRMKSYYYIPWNLEKYEATYGMSLGPSITIAPFNYIDVDGLHFFKINAYYHVGYQVSVLYMRNNKELDENHTGQGYEYMSENLKLSWGHGMYKAFGASLSWKAIGVGFEKRMGSTKYQSLNTADFGKSTYDFDSNFTRFYIQFRM